MSKPILVVIEDEPSVCESIDLILKDDYELRFFHTAETGLAALRTLPEALVVLLDIRLPDQDGISVLAKIKKQFPYLKVAIVTAGRIDSLQDAAHSLKVDDYIIKPFEIDDFAARIASLVSQAQE